MLFPSSLTSILAPSLVFAHSLTLYIVEFFRFCTACHGPYIQNSMFSWKNNSVLYHVFIESCTNNQHYCPGFVGVLWMKLVNPACFSDIITRESCLCNGRQVVCFCISNMCNPRPPWKAAINMCTPFIWVRAFHHKMVTFPFLLRSLYSPLLPNFGVLEINAGTQTLVLVQFQ